MFASIRMIASCSKHTVARNCLRSAGRWNTPPIRIARTYCQNAPKNVTEIASKRENLVGKWLLTCSGMVFVAVALGGVTRLTESGLSMVTWKLLGEQRPRTQSDWEAEFRKYQQFPEYKMKNKDMTLEEFKFIYYMEYIHRQWGRTIGAVFLIPAAIFWKKGYFCSKTKRHIAVLATLLGLQGLMGWYMVKSGLEDRFADQNDVPRVSHYRLASHLALAFGLYSIFLTTALGKLKLTSSAISTSQRFLRLKNLSLWSALLVGTTAVSGAFVAGLHAGLVYNSFPKMGDKWIPDDILQLEPKFRNFVENPVAVQFVHRILGISTVSLVTYTWLHSRRVNLPSRARLAINCLLAMAWIQPTLGVLTLVNHVPIPLATAHQSGSLVLLSFALWFCHEARFIRYIIK